MAIPLKALGLSNRFTKEFSYNVKVNGLQVAARNQDGGDVMAAVALRPVVLAVM